MKKSAKIFIILGSIILLICLVVITYIAYVFISFYRIEDNKVLDVSNSKISSTIETDKSYKVMTFNIGFGAYDDQFTFFMDTGYEDSEKKIKTKGYQSWATDKQHIYNNIEGCISVINSKFPDFIMLQEVDDNSTRTYHINEVELITNEFKDFSFSQANDYHSAFLFYPFTQPHGKSSSNLITLSKTNIISSLRRSLPLSDSKIANIMDLDRCIMINRYEIQDSDKQFVLINIHLSAYDEGGKIRKKQNELLREVLENERKNGNYVILGGDFNQVLIPNGTEYYIKQNGEITPDWVAEFEGTFEGYTLAYSTEGDDGANFGTARNNTKPFNKNWTYTCTIDGFVVSNNIEIEDIKNITSHTFKYSDHNPVLLTFKMK